MAAKVRRTFYEGLAAEKITQARREQVESAQTFFESAKKRAESGYTSDFGTIKSQSDLIAAKKALQQAEVQITNARVSLNTFMARPPRARLELTGTLENVQPRGDERGLHSRWRWRAIQPFARKRGKRKSRA